MGEDGFIHTAAEVEVIEGIEGNTVGLHYACVRGIGGRAEDCASKDPIVIAFLINVVLDLLRKLEAQLLHLKGIGGVKLAKGHSPFLNPVVVFHTVDGLAVIVNGADGSVLLIDHGASIKIGLDQGAAIRSGGDLNPADCHSDFVLGMAANQRKGEHQRQDHSYNRFDLHNNNSPFCRSSDRIVIQKLGRIRPL